jgi:hypothetical protein
MPQRPLHELLNTDEPAWPLVRSWLGEATNYVEALPPSDPARAEALLATQVTTRSPLGAVIYETGGLLVDHGWLRVLGSGHPRLPRTLPAWNLGRSRPDPDEPRPSCSSPTTWGGLLRGQRRVARPGEGGRLLLRAGQPESRTA